MRIDALAQTALAMSVNITSGFAFRPALRFPRKNRRFPLGLLIAAILASPLLILPPHAGLLRFIMSAMAVIASFSLYDLHMDPPGLPAPGPLALAGRRINPFAVVWRKVSAEPRPAHSDLVRFAMGVSLGLTAIVLMAWVFHIDWTRHPFALEHCAKVISFLLVIQLLPNGLAAGCRLAGLPATNFAGNFFLSPTPAEFWRRYNRPIQQFLHRYVFRPAGGLHHPLRATLATFAFSAIVHEYIFDIAARRLLGYQLMFFLLHGVASALTLRVQLNRRGRLAAILLTTAFNLATAYLFFASMNAFVPFYVTRAE
jgi:hypothetical protein